MKNTNRRITRKNGKDAESKRHALLAATACGVILLSGFFFAGRQHFSSMDYGIRNSRLRKQLEDLKAEKQRLLYTREVALSPNEIKKAALKAGVVESYQDSVPAPELASVRKGKKTTSPQTSEREPLVIKTAAIKPTSPRIERTIALVPREDSRKSDRSR